jgi:hypothetical protein
MTTFLVDSPHAPQPALAIDKLQTALREVEPMAVLVAPWVLQNVIVFDRGAGRSPFTVSHGKLHIISRQRLMAIADDKKLVLPEIPDLPMLILFVRPETDWLKERSEADALREYWRLLFHARIDIALGSKLVVPPCARQAIEPSHRTADRSHRPNRIQRSRVCSPARKVPAAAG